MIAIYLFVQYPLILTVECLLTNKLQYMAPVYSAGNTTDWYSPYSCSPDYIKQNNYTYFIEIQKYNYKYHIAGFFKEEKFS